MDFPQDAHGDYPYIPSRSCSSTIPLEDQRKDYQPKSNRTKRLVGLVGETTGGQQTSVRSRRYHHKAGLARALAFAFGAASPAAEPTGRHAAAEPEKVSRSRGSRSREGKSKGGQSRMPLVAPDVQLWSARIPWMIMHYVGPQSLPGGQGLATVSLLCGLVGPGPEKQRDRVSEVEDASKTPHSEQAELTCCGPSKLTYEDGALGSVPRVHTWESVGSSGESTPSLPSTSEGGAAAAPPLQSLARTAVDEANDSLAKDSLASSPSEPSSPNPLGLDHHRYVCETTEHTWGDDERDSPWDSSPQPEEQSFLGASLSTIEEESGWEEDEEDSSFQGDSCKGKIGSDAEGASAQICASPDQDTSWDPWEAHPRMDVGRARMMNTNEDNMRVNEDPTEGQREDPLGRGSEQHSPFPGVHRIMDCNQLASKGRLDFAAQGVLVQDKSGNDPGKGPHFSVAGELQKQIMEQDPEAIWERFLQRIGQEQSENPENDECPVWTKPILRTRAMHRNH